MLKSVVKRFLAGMGYEVHKKSVASYRSETSKCRARLERYCTGCGIDIGPGGDPITAAAVRVDLHKPYANVGSFPVQLPGDAAKLAWFQNGVLDFVYSSHVLEDFEDTAEILKEWQRVIKSGGLLVLYCPDEQRFRQHCATTGQPYNTAHKLEYFSYELVLGVLKDIDLDGLLVYGNDKAEIYSWDLVWRKGTSN